MISNFFYAVEIDNSIDSFLYDEKYLFYFVCLMIYKKGPADENTIKQWIISKTNTKTINHRKFIHFLSKFSKKDEMFYIEDKQIKFLNETLNFNKKILEIETKTQDEIYKCLCSNISSSKFNIFPLIPYIFMLDRRRTKREIYYYSALFFYNIINYENNYKKISNCVFKIDDKYKNITIDFVFTEKLIHEVMFANGVTTIYDIINLSTESLILIFSINIDYYVSILYGLTESFESSYKNKITTLFNKLEENEKEIIYLRNGFIEDRILTLEEIGQKYKLTREAIRQIEKKAIKKIVSSIHLFNIIFATIYFNLIKEGEKYFTKKRIFNFISNDTISYILIFLINQSDSYIKYDSKLGIIYNKKTISIVEVETDIINKYDYCITKKEFDLLSDLEQKVITDNYRFLNEKIYLRKGFLERKLYTNIIDDLFPKGYHISDNESFLKIKKEFEKRYDFWDENLTPRLISTYTERENYCQIDKGKYKNRQYVVSLGQELKDKIINFIFTNNSIVFYQTIFEYFKDDLIEIGVDNYYYLKGLIDYDLPDVFTTKRNYIQTSENKLTSSETIVKLIRSFNHIFTFDDIKSKFVGINDSVIYEQLYSEDEKGLIWLSSKKFIYFNNANISEETKNELYTFIQATFKSLNTKFLSSRKIYSKLALTNRNLLENLKIVKDQFSMFSIIKYLYKDFYFFNRPIISLDKKNKFTQESIIRDYVCKLDRFDYKTIKSYQEKLSLRGLYSYLSFMEDISEDFVQVDIDCMVRKDLLRIDDLFIKEFKELFDLIFNKFCFLDTRTFNGYMLLPNLELKWNKYLLIGIIRTFFSDVYEIENTENSYDITDFIIKKINGGKHE